MENVHVINYSPEQMKNRKVLCMSEMVYNSSDNSYKCKLIVSYDIDLGTHRQPILLHEILKVTQTDTLYGICLNLDALNKSFINLYEL
jgi:hypothetical protein